MRRRLGRYIAVGAIATAVDLLVYLLGNELGGDAGWPLVAGDVAALVVAASVSLALHRLVTLHDDPSTRWIRYPEIFVGSAVLAGAVDLLVLVQARPHVSAVTAKVAAIAGAALVRLVLHRTFLFRRIRSELGSPARRSPLAEGPRLTVVVPAFREGDRIATTVHRLRAELAPTVGDDLEIVVVDDGSGDATGSRARAAGADQVIVLPRNRGKGGAVRAGMMAATGRTVAFTDADLSYEPSELVPFLTVIEDGWDVAVGSRQHIGTTTVVRAAHVREIGSRLINLATFVLLVGQYRDTQCGIKAFRRDVARVVFGPGRVDGFAFDVEVFHLVERYRLSLCELPVSVVNSERSTVRITRDAVRLLGDLMRIRRWGRQGVYSQPVDLPAPAA